MTERELNERLDAVDRERAEEVAAAHAALAAAQDRSYWLDRWHVDLNAVMRKPGAGVLRAAFRAMRVLYRLAYDTRNRTGEAVDLTRERIAGARERVEHEGGAGEAAVPAAEPPPFARLRATPVSAALAGADDVVVDRDDPHALAALARADAIVAGLAHAGIAPRDGDLWLGVGPASDEVLRLLRAAYPDVRWHREDGASGAETAQAAFAISGWTDAGASLARLRDLHAVVGAGGSLVLGAERGAQAAVTPAWLAAHATPEWRVALYLPGGLEGDRDLYVLERA